MGRGESDSPGSRALRSAGFVKLPNWWVTQEQFELIEYMARQNLETINRIKDRHTNVWSKADYERDT
jgi:hypothetical protein